MDLRTKKGMREYLRMYAILREFHAEMTELEKGRYDMTSLNRIYNKAIKSLTKKK